MIVSWSTKIPFAHFLYENNHPLFQINPLLLSKCILVKICLTPFGNANNRIPMVDEISIDLLTNGRHWIHQLLFKQFGDIIVFPDSAFNISLGCSFIP